MTIHWLELQNVAKNWTYEAGELIKKSLQKPIQIESKSNDNDLVTEVDRAVEAFFYEKIQTTYPEHSFLGEEGIAEDYQDLNGTVWVIDPIDGTMNFVHQRSKFAISVAIYHEGIGKIGIVYDVMSDEMFWAMKGHGAFLNGKPLSKLEERPIAQSIIGLNGKWIVEDTHAYRQQLTSLIYDARGMRCYGSAAIELAYVAANRTDAYMSVNLSPWDYAAGVVIVEEVGGQVSSFANEPLSIERKSSLIAAKSNVHNEVIKNYLHK